MEALLISLLIVVLVLVAAWYITGLIPDATIQKVARVIIVVIALLWLIRNVRPIIHSLS